MTYVQRIQRSILFVALFTVIGSASSFLLRVALARGLSVFEYGLFYTVYAFVYLLFSFRDLGMSMALIKYIPEWLVRKKTAMISSSIWHIIWVQLAYGVVVFSIVFAAREWLVTSYFHTPEAMPILLILLVLLFIEPLLSTLMNVFIGHQAIGWSTSVNALRILLTVVTSIILLAAGFGAVSAAYAYVLSAAILIPFYIFVYTQRVFPSFRWRVRFEMRTMRLLFGYGKYFVIAGIGSLVFVYADSLLLAYFAGIESVGLYNAVIPITSTIMATGQLLLSIVTPLSSELYASKKKNVIVGGLRYVYKYFIIGALPVMAAAILFPVQIIDVIFGREYIAAAPALQILTVGALLWVFAAVNFSVLAGTGKPRMQAYVMAIAAVLNIILNILFIPSLGIVGAATATTIAYALLLVCSFVGIQRIFHTRIPYGAWAKVFVITAVLATGAKYATGYLQWNPLAEMVFLTVAFIILYGGALFATRTITREEIRLISPL